MKFFRLIRSDVDVAPLLANVRAHEESGLLNTTRQNKIRVQQDTQTIFISSALSRPNLNINENQEYQLIKTSVLFPKALTFMNTFAHEMNMALSRTTIVRLKPHSRVSRHIDAGSYYFIRDRYHLVLYSPAGSSLTSGDENVRMQAGELRWFNNKQYHEASNESAEWRIHYIFDLLHPTYEHFAINPLLLRDF